MRVPFAIQSYRDRSLPVSAQRTVNLFAETAPQGARTPIVLFGTPGMTLFAGLGGSTVRGIHVMAGELYAVSGTSLYKIASSGAVTILGTVTSTGTVYMSDDGTNLAVLVGSTLYVWDGSDLTQVTDADLVSLSSVDFLDGYLLGTKTDTGKFVISNLNDFTAWDALDIATAEGAPDDLLRVFVDHREAWLFGSDSTEVWYNSGAADFPFERVSGGFIETGIMAANAAAKLDNTIFWGGNDRVVYRGDGFHAVRVSTHAIEKMLADAETISDAYAFSYKQEGHQFFVLTLPTAEFTVAYDAATQLWHERQSRDLGYWRPANYAYCYGKHIIGDSQSGNLLALSLDAYTENGDTIVRTTTGLATGDGSKRVFQSALEIEVESGVGLTTGQGSDPQLMLDWSDDGGRTFGNERWASMGAKGEYKKRVRFNRLGSFRERVYRLTISDPVKSVVIGAGD